MLTKGTKATIWMGAITFCLFAFMFIFRAFIYADMYVEPGAPYGISDIIELFLGLVFLVLVALCVCLSLALFIKVKKESKKSGVWLIIFCVLLLISYSPLHHIAANISQ